MSEQTEWVLVETISTHRIRYLVEVPKDHADYALDTVVMQEAKEFSQKYLDELIVSHRVLSVDDALALSDVDNDYTLSWNTEQKMDAFFTTTKEQEQARKKVST